MKFKMPEEVGASAAIVPGGNPPPGGGDWLTRINEVITNFKGLVEAARAAQGQGAPGQNILAGSPDTRALTRGNLNSPAAAFIDYLVKEHGDTTVGQILGDLSPMTIKQIAELLKNVGLIK